MKNYQLILIPKWFPEFIKRWILKDGIDGDLIIRSGETHSVNKEMKYGNLIIEDKGILQTNGHRIYVRGLLILNGEIKF